MVRTAVWYVFFGITVILSIPVILYTNWLEKKGRDQESTDLVCKLVSWWSRKLIAISGSDVKVIGLENVPKDQAVLFVGNHQSNFDIPVLLGLIPMNKGFIAKAELEKLPIVSIWMKKTRSVFIARGEGRKALEAITKGVKILKSGHSMVIFPEGTRSADGALGPFKPGSLRLASKAQVAIVPVTLNGTKDIMRKGSKMIRTAKVEMIISPAIPVEVITNLDTTELAQMVRNTIEQNLR